MIGEVKKLMLIILAFSISAGFSDEPELVLPLAGEISVEMFATPGVPGGDVFQLAVARLVVTFPFPVEISWGKLKQDPNGRFCVEVEGYRLDGITPQVVTTYSQSVELGMFEPGDYEASLKSGGEILGKNEFFVNGGGNIDLVNGLPSRVKIDIVQLPTRGLYPTFAANIQMTFDQYVDHVDWGDVSRKENRVESEMTAWIDPSVRILTPMIVEEQIGLGMFFPGDYHYQLNSLKEVISGANISVAGPQRDFSPPKITVRGALVDRVSDEPLEFSVEFFDDAELVFDGIETQVLSVINRKDEIVELERSSLNFTADMSVAAIATYRMNPPGGSWDYGDRGRYRILLSRPELIRDLYGNSLVDPFIGYLNVEIEPEDPKPAHNTELILRIDEITDRWKARARIFVPEDLAVRDDWAVDWGGVIPRGGSFFLQPRIVRAGSNEDIGFFPPSDTTGDGVWIGHSYDLGSISGGNWLIVLNSNLGHLAKEQLIMSDLDLMVEPQEPFDFWNDWVARETGLENDQRRFWEYCVGTDPADSSDDHDGDPRPELVTGDDGEKHLGIRCRMAMSVVDARLRFEGSSDMITWVELGPEEIKEVERVIVEDGIEEFLVCLVSDINTSQIRYLRVVAERW